MTEAIVDSTYLWHCQLSAKHLTNSIRVCMPAQRLTWAEDVAPVFKTCCARCGGVLAKDQTQQLLPNGHRLDADIATSLAAGTEGAGIPLKPTLLALVPHGRIAEFVEDGAIIKI
eukprot:CAMPEP_0119349012 /NCGR_PEP_ID=MMETSP1333-20130426/109336_1 /TAXON_ID=418940 /ORGANISM="Scyphosphaera apsteinii, Strain RCC1455" /LENGTH=114 /DNA_ID=CAMNT_0007361605 /DNA_START=455 /DNA_END=799 /DNA_ORIENTATION=+